MRPERPDPVPYFLKVMHIKVMEALLALNLDKIYF